MEARVRAWLLALAAPFLLIGCVVVPGRFAASLEIAADRSFAYRYSGEIVALDLGNEMAKGMKQSPDDEDEPEGTTLMRIAQAAKEADSKAERDAKFRELAAVLRKEAGYSRVDYKGDGLFQIDYAIKGRLTHGFVWPFNPDAEILFPFLAVELRGADTVRVKAPAFGEASDKALPMADDAGARREGTFTLTATAEIVSQNSEDGAKDGATGKTIVWKVTPLTKDAPMAVLRVAPLAP